MNPRNSHRDRQVSVAAISFVQLGITAVIAALGLLYPLLEIEPETVIPAQCWGLIALYCWSAWSWYRLTRQVFDWYLIFLTAAYVFNAGQAFLEAFHLNEHGILDAEFPAVTIMNTLYLVQLSMAAFHCGAIFTLAREFLIPSRAPALVATSPEIYASLRIVGCGLVLVALPFVVMLLKEAVGIVLSGGYFALYQQDSPTGLGAGPKVLAYFLIPGMMFLLAAGRESWRLRSVAIVLVAVYSAVNLFLGVRHEAAILFVAFAWLWDRQIRRINLTWVFAGGAFALLVLFPLVAATRNSTGSNRTSFAYLMNEYTTIKNPAVAAMHEMGGSMNTVAHTLDLVPATHDFERGEGYAYGVFTLFPNFFWDLHPSIARKLPGAWLTWHIDPITAEQGGGMGFSFLAEAYLNFGWQGLVPTLFVLGFLIAWAARWAEQSGHADQAAAVAAGGCFLVFYVRAELAVVLRGVVWYAALPYLATVLILRTQHVLGKRMINPPTTDLVLAPVQAYTES